jgi:PAS domain-containing protein
VPSRGMTDAYKKGIQRKMKKPARKAKALAKLPLEDSELRYRRLFEAAQDDILILDTETGVITDVNPFLIDMLRYSRAECIKKKLWETQITKLHCDTISYRNSKSQRR